MTDGTFIRGSTRLSDPEVYDNDEVAHLLFTTEQGDVYLVTLVEDFHRQLIIENMWSDDDDEIYFDNLDENWLRLNN